MAELVSAQACSLLVISDFIHYLSAENLAQQKKPTWWPLSE